MKKFNFTPKKVWLQCIQAAFLLFIIPSVGFAQLPAGTYSVGPTGDYSSLSEAFDIIASDSILGDIILELEDSHVENNLSISGVGYATATITVRPAADAQFVLFSGRTHFTGGSENIIFDGRPGGTGDAFPGGNGVMIFRESDNNNGNGAIHQQGAGFLAVRYADVRSDARYGIFSQFSGGGITVENCRITSFQTGFNSNEDQGTEYVRTLFTNGDITIRNNTMSGLIANDQAKEAVGILLIHPQTSTDPPVTWTIENNAIEITKPDQTKFSVGIRLNTPNGWTNTDDVFKVNHNTVLLRGNNTNTEAGTVSSAFYRFANAPLEPHTMEVKNNIFVNRIEGGDGVSHSAAWIRADADGVLENADIDFNNYYSATNTAAFGNPDAGLTAYTTLADWQGFSGQDENTTSVEPTFTDVDAGDLSLDVPTDGSVTWFFGTGIGVDTDINGMPRKPFTPTKGAYEVVLPCIPAGVYTVAADPGNPGSADYASLEDAFDDIRIKCLDGDIALELESGFTANNLSLVAAGDPNFTTTIRPAADALFTLFSGRTHFTGGSENIIFDGRPGGTGDAFPGGNGVMIFRESDNTNGNGAIHQQGAGFLAVRYADIRSDARYGIFSQFSGQGLTVENCRITSFQTGFNGNEDQGTEYVRTLFTNGDITIRNNTMSGLMANDLAKEAVGVLLIHPQGSTNPPVTWTIENNAIEITKPDQSKFSVGIRLNTPNGWTNTDDVFKINHNTVLLRGNNTNTEAGAVSSAFYRFANAPLEPHTMEIKNNIFVNLIEGGDGVSHSAAWIRADADGILENADIDFNNYYSATNTAAFGNPEAGLTAYTTLADWQAFSDQDENTTSVEPTFTDVDAGDLSLDPAALTPDDLWVLGTALGVETDINGTTRDSNSPTKGAYEQNVVSALRDIQDVSRTLRVFPNPAGEVLNLQMDNPMRGRVRISATNIMGQELRAFEIEKDQALLQMEIGLQGLPKGLLFIVARGSQYQAVQRVVHQ